MKPLKYATAASIKLGPFLASTDGITPQTSLTIARANIRLAKEGGAFAQTHNATGATADENGFYTIPLDTTDTNTLGRLRVAVTLSGSLSVWDDFVVLPAAVYTSFIDNTGRDPIKYLAAILALLGGKSTVSDNGVITTVVFKDVADGTTPLITVALDDTSTGVRSDSTLA